MARDGGVFTYGDAGYFGSLGGTTLPGPVVGVAGAGSQAGYFLAVGSEPLAGEVVGIDPGHNGLNDSAPGVINQPVFNGTGDEPCDTTGTATDSGYTEAQFNFNVATYLEADLQAEGATVVLTRPDNDGVGPCVTTRAAIINDAHADVAVDIHADGGPADGRGFAVLEPTADGPNDGVIASSAAFAATLRNAFVAGTTMPVSTYDGVDGLQPRNDLAGLNLTTVPKVLVECGNMRNATDAALLVTPAFQQARRRRHGPGHHELPRRGAGLIRPACRGAPGPASCRRVHAGEGSEATRSTWATGKVEAKAIPASSAWACGPSRPLTRARVRWPLKGGSPPGRPARIGSVAAPHSGRQFVEPVGRELEHPHPREPGRGRAELAVDRPGLVPHGVMERVAERLELLLVDVAQEPQRHVPAGRTHQPQVPPRARARARPAADA